MSAWLASLSWGSGCWTQWFPQHVIWQLAVGLSALLLTLVFLGPRKHDLHRIPGPAGLPLLGIVLEFGSPRAHHYLIEWGKKWRTYKFRLLHVTNVVLTDPAEFPHLLGRTRELPKAYSLIYEASQEIFDGSGVTNFFTTRDQAMWAAVRKGCAPAFSPESARKALPVIRATTEEVCTALDHAAQAGLPMDLADAAMRVALDVFGRIAFGHDFNARAYGECDVLEALPTLLAEFSRRMVNPLRALKHCIMPFTSEAREYKKNRRIMYALYAKLARLIQETDLQAAEAAGDMSLRACMARLRHPATGELLTERQLASNAAAFLVAGFETTAHSVAWALYEITRHSEVQAKLAAELEAAGLLWAAGKQGRELEYADLTALPYLGTVWKEALRHHPVAAFSPIREADRDITLLSGLRIPRGTVVWMPGCAVHSTHWNYVDPDRFWPERWGQGEADAPNQSDPDGGAAAEKGGTGAPTPSGNTSSIKFSFMPFSYGPHDCMGQALANVEGKAMLAMLCSRFQFAVAPRMGSPEEVRAAEVNRLTMQAGKGVWLLLTPRGA